MSSVSCTRGGGAGGQRGVYQAEALTEQSSDPGEQGGEEEARNKHSEAKTKHPLVGILKKEVRCLPTHHGSLMSRYSKGAQPKTPG